MSYALRPAYGPFMWKCSVGDTLVHGPSNRCIGQDFVLLHTGPCLVLFIDILERGFSQQFPRQNHHANESAWSAGAGLRENSIRAALVPRSAGTVGRRGALCVDANAAFDQATNPGPPMPMQKGTAAGGKADAVTAQEQLPIRQCLKLCSELFRRSYAG